jgi:uncharacterized membrane protein YeaQ/YmgE (transglycosylase-associated protein family)
MNPSYGIVLWIVIGGLAGWIASKLMGTDARQGVFANIVIGVAGAVLAGSVSRHFFGADNSNNGLIGSFVVALLGACSVIGAGKILLGKTA